MTDNSPLTDHFEADRNLDYQFYFLFRGKKPRNALVVILLIIKIIFEWFDNIARDLRAGLQQKNPLYYEKKDGALKYTPTAILEEQFRDMDQSVTEANFDKFVEPFQSQTDNLVFDGLQTFLHTLIGILQNQWVYVAILLLSVGYLIFYYVVEYLWYYIYKLRTYLRRTRR